MDSNKVTIVTGAASGIGRATAIFLAKRGHQVVCTDLPASQLLIANGMALQNSGSIMMKR